MGIIEKIAEIEKEIARTQKNKATEYHLGTLKAKLAKYRAELLAIRTKEAAAGGGGGEGFDVMKSGDARIALIGLPSVGKSTLLCKLTESQSATAAYEFTTLTCIPGNLQINGANIQLLDLPGIIEGASQGRGRGRQVIAVARTCDMVLMLLDATKSDCQRTILERELESMGIRLNVEPPNVAIRLKTTSSSGGGGIAITSTCKLTHLADHRLIQSILQEYRIFNVELIIKEDITQDQLIDALNEAMGHPLRYCKCIYVYNKADSITIEELDRIMGSDPLSVCISAEQDWGLDYLAERIWEELQLTRVYTKKRAEMPDWIQPLILRRGATVEHACHALHRSIIDSFKYALVWGQSAKHQPQKVGLGHVLLDEDVIQVVKKT